jgi:hypothetical protein
LNEFEREYHVARLIAGGPTFRHCGVPYRLTAPCREARLEAAEIRLEAYRDGAMEGIPTRAQLLETARRLGLWNGEEGLLAEAEARIDDLKAKLYEGRHSESTTRIHREALARAKAEYGRLLEGYHRFDGRSLETYARSAGARYLAGSSLLQRDGSPYWPDRADGWLRSDSDAVVEAAMRRLVEDRLGPAGLRELARSEEWMQVWNARSCDESPFGVPAADLCDERRGLLGWSRLYEAAAQRPDGPRGDVAADDDMFDGWLVLERRRRDGETLEDQFNRQVSGKVRGMDEVFVVMDPDAKEGSIRSSPRLLDTLNDEEALRKKSARAAYLKQLKTAAEADLPDVRRRNQMAINQAASARHNP